MRLYIKMTKTEKRYVVETTVNDMHMGSDIIIGSVTANTWVRHCRLKDEIWMI